MINGEEIERTCYATGWSEGKLFSFDLCPCTGHYQPPDQKQHPHYDSCRNIAMKRASILNHFAHFGDTCQNYYLLAF